MLKALLIFGSTYQPAKVQFIMELYYQTGCVCSLPFVGSFVLQVMCEATSLYTGGWGITLSSAPLFLSYRIIHVSWT